MEKVWIVFIASVLMIGGTGWNLMRRAQGRAVLDLFDKPLPWQWDAMLMFLGVVGVLSTVPGLFFGQPSWAIDHVYRLISKVAGNAV